MVVQKMVFVVHMTCDKCRSKALATAAAAKGVTMVSIEGEEREKVMVIGDGVDMVSLTRSLKNKVGQTTLLSVEVLTSSAAEVDSHGDDEDDTGHYCDYQEQNQYQQHTGGYCYSLTTYNNYPHEQFYACKPVRDHNPPSCSIM